MIELKLTGPCADCAYINLSMDHIWGDGRKFYTVNCQHAAICGRLEQETLSRKPKKLCTPEDLRQPMETRD